ncbi:TonB-dependent receptor [Flavobacteriaceae bacterium MHTCC 0001]
MDIDVKKVSLEELFKEIQNKSEYIFFYKDDIIDQKLKVSVKLQDAILSKILDKSLKKASLDYVIIGRQVVIKKKNAPLVDLEEVNTVQKISVTGKVSDANGLPLPGVNILEKGTTNGVVTDFDGSFNISVSSSSAVLVFSSLGFGTQEITVGQKTTLNITMEEDTTGLDEVVVVGYGTQKKSDVTGAIASISGADVNITREGNPLNALAGKVSGVDISINSNDPGSSPSILIRGRSSLNFSNEPLLVVDGIPVNGGLGDFNPADIASMEVLKDASSAAIYGARGANGVILITTKRGKVGKARITYDTYYGTSIFEKIELTNAQQWVDMRLEAFRAATDDDGDGVNPFPVGTTPILTPEQGLENLQLEAYNAGVDTSTQDALFRDAIQLSHQLGISGGSEKVRYAVSFNYFSQEGDRKETGYERFTFRSNLDFDISDRLKLGISQQASFSDQDRKSLNFVLTQSPLTRLYNDDGSPTIDPLADGLIWNPINNYIGNNWIDNEKNLRYFANIFATYNFNDNLKYRLNIGPELEVNRRNLFYGSQSSSRQGGLNQARKDTRVRNSYTIENILTYDKVFNDVHALNATLLFSVQDTQNETLGATVEDVPSETQTFNALEDATTVLEARSGLDEESWISYMARFNYGYDDRYLLTLTARRDGSSKLSEGNKWGFFPSGSFAWRIINENFMENTEVFSDLKLRVGYGTVGRNPINPYDTQGVLARTDYSFGGSSAFGYTPEEIANPNLKWEITTTLDVGLDFALFNNRIAGSIDWYQGNTSDLLLRSTLPATSGFDFVLTNVGKTKNTGVEVNLTTRIIAEQDFRWTVDWNFATNKSTIEALNSGQIDDPGNSWFRGQPLAVRYSQVFDGIWQLGEEDAAAVYNRRPGEIRIADLNDDGQLNDLDRRIIGQLDPKWIGGLTSRMSYKNLSLDVSLYTRQGHITEVRTLTQNNSLFGRYNNLNVNYWTPENPSNEFPRPNANQTTPKDSGLLQWRDASFTRIRNITLGYDFNEGLANKMGLQSLRIYATAQNPFLFTKTDIPGFDPDTANGSPDSSINPNGRANYLPLPTTLILGLNVSL